MVKECNACWQAGEARTTTATRSSWSFTAARLGRGSERKGGEEEAEEEEVSEEGGGGERKEKEQPRPQRTESKRYKTTIDPAVQRRRPTVSLLPEWVGQEMKETGDGSLRKSPNLHPTSPGVPWAHPRNGQIRTHAYLAFQGPPCTKHLRDPLPQIHETGPPTAPNLV